jgi:hypothetical protein
VNMPALSYSVLRFLSSASNYISIHDNHITTFAEDTISLLTGYLARRNLVTGDIATEIAIGLRDEGIGQDIEPEAVSIGLDCLLTRWYRTEKDRNFTSALLGYDIPFSHSPTTRSDSLLQLLETGKKMCLAPLAAGGTLGVGQLGQGQYVAAILSVGAGSLMTLILLGTIAVGSLLIGHVVQQRSMRRGRT